MKMNLRMKKCWMKRGGPGWNWRHVCLHLRTLNAPQLPKDLSTSRSSLSKKRHQSFVFPLTGGKYHPVESQERWGGKRNKREQRTYCQMVRWQVSVTSRWMLGSGHCEQNVLCVWHAFKFPTLTTACPFTWGTKCLMFTKLLSRETTTTCSSDRALDCKDRLFSKPSSRSGNTLICLCCTDGKLLLGPDSRRDKHFLLRDREWIA